MQVRDHGYFFAAVWGDLRVLPSSRGRHGARIEAVRRWKSQQLCLNLSEERVQGVFVGNGLRSREYTRNTFRLAALAVRVGGLAEPFCWSTL